MRSLRKGPKIIRCLENYPVRHLGSDSEDTETDLVCHSRNDLSRDSRENLDQKQPENTLKIYLDKKLGRCLQ